MARFANGTKHYGYGRRVDADIPDSWKWCNGKNIQAEIPTPRDKIHGRRHLGTKDITDVPTNFDVSLVMPLPWMCKCGRALMYYDYFCQCGRITPLGVYSRDQENWWRG